MRLIDADALLDKLNSRFEGLSKAETIAHIENAPTVQREGWVSVPIEPTEEMIEGFWGEIKHGQPEIEAAKEAYKAMLSAAPKE